MENIFSSFELDQQVVNENANRELALTLAKNLEKALPLNVVVNPRCIKTYHNSMSNLWILYCGPEHKQDMKEYGGVGVMVKIRILYPDLNSELIKESIERFRTEEKSHEYVFYIPLSNINDIENLRYLFRLSQYKMYK